MEQSEAVILKKLEVAGQLAAAMVSQFPTYDHRTLVRDIYRDLGDMLDDEERGLPPITSSLLELAERLQGPADNPLGPNSLVLLNLCPRHTAELVKQFEDAEDMEVTDLTANLAMGNCREAPLNHTESSDSWRLPQSS